MNDPLFRPFDPDVLRDPYPHYARLRRERPVHYSEPYDMWVLTRYADVHFVLTHPELFSSTAMTIGSPTGPARNVPSAVQMQRTALLIASDPPLHTKMRHLVNRGFTPRQIAALQPRVEEIAKELMAALPAGAAFDLVEAFTAPLPVTVICELLGIDPERRVDFKRWSDDISVFATGNPSPEEQGRFARSTAELQEFLKAEVEARRGRRGHDLISVLIHAEEVEEALTPDEVVLFVLLLLIAGNETTTNLLSNGTIALLRDRAQLGLLEADPSRVAGLIEETLRHHSPIQAVLRLPTQDVEIGGTEIPKGALVCPLLGAANRDPERFPDPDRFDIGRDAQGHLAFGFGIHFCLGASLARLEARIGFEALLPRLARLELAEEPRFVPSLILRGPRHLTLAPVRV